MWRLVHGGRAPGHKKWVTARGGPGCMPGRLPIFFGSIARQITIDAAGRLVIPKDVRDRLRLRGGSRLRLIEAEARIVLEPEPVEVVIREKAGILVLSGDLEGEVPDHRLVRQERLDRPAPR